MLAPLRCPTCSAPLNVPPEHATTTRCTYCGAGVLLTERGGRVQAAAQQQRHADGIGDVLGHLRVGDRIGAVRAYREHFGVGMAEATYAVERIEAGQRGGAPSTPAATAPASRSAAPPPTGRPRAVAAALFIAALSAGVVVAVSTTLETPASAPGAAAPLRPADAPPAFAREVLRFGSEGNGAGRFDDARIVAVDGTGRLYVPDYGSGRVQVFDSAGTFLTQWILDPERSISDMEVDRQGTLWVVWGGYILRVDATTGRVLGELPQARFFGYEDVALALDGTLWATDGSSVRHLDRNGRVLREIAVSEAVPGGGSANEVVVSGDGDLYLLNLMGREIYHLDPSGRFVDRIGVAAEPGPGKPTPTMQEMALDGRGRLYVSMLGGGIRVHDPNGQQIGVIETEESVYGLAFNDRDELYAVLNLDHQIVKFRLNH